LGLDVGDGYFGGPFFIFAEVFGLGPDWLAGFVFFVFFFVVFAAPRIFAERGLVYRAGINDYAGFDDGLEIGSAQVGGCGLQSIEEETGSLGVQLSTEDQAHDLH